MSFIQSFIAPKEQYLQRDFGISFEDHGYLLKIDARTEQNGFRPNFISKVSLVNKKAKLLFQVTKCNVPEPYRLMWKVKNTGKEAARLGQQRGEIIWDKGKKIKEENTLYTGTHFVECYVINNQNICIAWDRIRVRIP